MKTYFFIFLCKLFMDASFFGLIWLATLSKNILEWPIDDRVTFGMCLICTSFFMVIIFLLVHFKRLNQTNYD